MIFKPLELNQWYTDKSKFSAFYVKGQNVKTIFQDLTKELLKEKKLLRNEFAATIAEELKKDVSTIEKFIYSKDYFPTHLIIYLIQKLQKDKQDHYYDSFNAEITHFKSGKSGGWAAFPKELNQNISWICGAIAADGWISVEKDGKHRMGIIDQYKGSIELAQAKFQAAFDFKPHVYKCKKVNAWMLVCDNKAIVRFFIEHVKCKSGYKTDSVSEPEIIKQSPHRLDFARGVLIFDGSAELSGAISLGMLSHELVKDIHNILTTHGFDIAITKRENNSFLKSKSIYRLQNPDNWIDLFENTTKSNRLKSLFYGFKESAIQEAKKVKVLNEFVGKSNSRKYNFLDLFNYLKENGCVSRKNVVKHFGYAHATIYCYWKILTMANVITTKKQGREQFYTYNDKSETWKMPIYQTQSQ